MPAGRYFQGLTTFDLLGNFIPGVIIIVGMMMLFPSIPTPSSVGGYFLVGLAAFSLGHFVQHHASYATGDRQTFERTMDTVRGGQLDNEGDDADNNEIESDENTQERSIGQLICDLVTRVLHHSFYAMTMPIFWWMLSSRGKALDDVILPNRVWKDLLETYDIDRGTSNYSVLFHMISSEIDDIGSPSRATRFQAIRNFHRGMWISIWYLLSYIIMVLMFEKILTILGLASGKIIIKSDSFLYTIFKPWWLILPILITLLVGFWYLADNYEEEFIEYLFTDYVVGRKSKQDTVGGLKNDKQKPGDSE